MKLYYSPGACSLAPHIAARELGLDIDLVKVDLAEKKTADGRDYLTVNPKGAVPALELDDGQVLTENAVVLQYLADRKPDGGLVPPAGGLEHWRYLELLNFVATELHKGFGPLWKPTTPAEVRDSTVSDLGKRFDVLDRLLGDKPYLLGDRFNLVDAYAAVVLNWTDVHKLDTSRWPRLQAFVKRVFERPAARTALREEGLA